MAQLLPFVFTDFCYSKTNNQEPTISIIDNFNFN